MKVGVIGIPGKWSTEHLADMFGKRTGFRLVMAMEDVSLDLEARSFLHNGEPLPHLDAVVVKKISPSYSPEIMERLELLKFMHSLGISVFSRPAAIALAADRLACTLALRGERIPTPPTVITENPAVAREAVRRFGKAVLKPLYTSKARGMTVVEDGPQTEAALAAFGKSNPIFYVQKMMKTPGRDYGLVFLGGRYLATYARVAAEGSWNTTTHSGGTYQPYEPSPEMIALADRSQRCFGLDFTCVDVAETESGLVVYEVSAFGGFHGLKDANGLDGAALYADYVLEKLADD